VRHTLGGNQPASLDVDSTGNQGVRDSRNPENQKYVTEDVHGLAVRDDA
jgi:hypothetical protein